MTKLCLAILVAGVVFAGCEPADPSKQPPADDGNKTTPAKPKEDTNSSSVKPKDDTNSSSSKPPAEETVKLKDMEKRDADGNLVGLTQDGLWHQRGEKEPFTGVVAGHYKNGHMESRREYKNGVQIGTETHWYNNGQKKWEIEYKDGEMVSHRQWDVDGNEQK